MNKRTYLCFGLCIIGAGVGTYIFLPKAIEGIKKSTGDSDSWPNRGKKFMTDTSMGKTLIGAGLFLGGIGIAGAGMYTLSFAAQGSRRFVSMMDMKPMAMK